MLLVQTTLSQYKLDMSTTTGSQRKAILNTLTLLLLKKPRMLRMVKKMLSPNQLKTHMLEVSSTTTGSLRKVILSTLTHSNKRERRSV